jgi:hypothetical protein
MIHGSTDPVAERSRMNVGMDSSRHVAAVLSPDGCVVGTSREGIINPHPKYSKVLLFLVAMSLVPFVCVALPEEWRSSVFTSGIVLEFLAVAIVYFAHSRWQARRRDYCVWLRLDHRRVSDL